MPCRGGNRLLSLSTVQGRFAEAGYKLLEESYSHNNIPLAFQCNNGHIGKMQLADFTKGHRCHECSLDRKRVKKEVIHEYGKSVGYEWLNDCDYKNSQNYLKLKCPNNHIWQVGWNSFRKGIRCRHCYYSKVKRSLIKWIEAGRTEEEFLKSRSFQGEWSKAIHERDKVCQFCFSDKKLRAHHILPFGQYPSLAEELDNGILLCFKCHAASGTGIHSILGVSYTHEEWLEFAEKRWLNPNFNNISNPSATIDLPNDLIDKVND